VNSKQINIDTSKTRKREQRVALEKKNGEGKRAISSLSLSRLFSIFFITTTAADPPPRFEREKEKRRIDEL